MSTALIHRAHDTALGRMADWTDLPDDERRRRAVVAARDHDSAALILLADAWLTLHGKAGARVSDHTRRNYTQGARVLLDAWVHENLLHPRRDAGAAWLRTMEAAGSSPSTIKVRLAAARTLYASLRWAGATDVDPFRDARPAKDPEKPWDKRGPYTPAEITAMLDALDIASATATPAARTMARYDRVLVLLGAHAGLRASEMIMLRWSDLDNVRRVVMVRHGKGGKGRQVVMGSTLAAALAAIPPEMRGEYVLPYRARNTALYRMMRLTTRLGLTHTGVHRLRHSAGTRLMAETHDLQEVAELLGHAQIETSRVYAHWTSERQRATVGEW